MHLEHRRATPDQTDRPTPRGGHEAWLYDDEQDMLEWSRRFVLDGLAAGDAVAVMLPPARLGALRSDLGEVADEVTWTDITEIGRNPARLTARWADALSQPDSGPIRGIVEPAYAGRTPDELEECEHHDALLDGVLHGAEARIACPYNINELPVRTIDRALITHPAAVQGASSVPSGRYLGPGAVHAVLTDPLSPVPRDAGELAFGDDELLQVRRVARQYAHQSGLGGSGLDELVLAINELAANSVRHGGGHGVLRYWVEAGIPVFEVHDAGRITDPMLGRRCPPPTLPGGRGLWMVHHLCDLVQVRSSDEGTRVRVRVRP
jgi:anti-sigma regulatory factor (Ser/Thr protein kinase)